MNDTQPDNLKPFLEKLLQEIDWNSHRKNDPVDLVWRCPEEEREVAGLLVSALAYGQVKVLKVAAAHALEALDWRPATTISVLSDADLQALFDGFVYRMTRGDDLADLFAGVRATLDEYGSLENAYLAAPTEAIDPIDRHIARASFLVQRIRAGRIRRHLARGLRYLIPDPADGSTAKRMHLYFRWMARCDAVDPGGWDAIPRSALIMPLDTHTSRLCRYLGLTRRKSQDLKAAREVTESLSLLDAEDPLRFDFALCHLGISRRCIHQRSEEHCPFCPIEPVCAVGQSDVT